MQCTKIPNWKAAGKDGVQRYWLKNLASLQVISFMQKDPYQIG